MSVVTANKAVKSKTSKTATKPSISLAEVQAIIDPSTPPFFRAIFEEQDESKLLNRLGSCNSYPEYVVVAHRLAQLRDTHAVTGILSSKAYQEAKARSKVAEQALKQAEQALAVAEKTKGVDEIEKQVEAEREDIRQGVLGFEWRYNVALATAQKHPDYLKLASGIAKEKRKLAADERALLRRRSELDRDLKKAILRNGPADKSVIKLRADLQALDAEIGKDDEKEPTLTGIALLQEQAKVLHALLGNEITTPDGQRYFDGSGELELEPLYQAHLDRYEVDVEMKVMERRVELSHTENAHLRVAVEQARENLKTVGHDLLVHNAALARAKARAEAARKRIVRFEPQLIDDNFRLTLNKRRGQLAAIFAEDSLYKDNFLYAFRTRGDKAIWLAFAEVAHGKDEQEVIAILSKQPGVRKTEQKVAAPDYKSWATLHATAQITVDLPGGGHIHYAPHSSFKLKGKSHAQAGPYSERGIIRITKLAPADAVELLQSLGLHKKLCDSVPYDLIYRGSHRLGRVHPPYEPLASGRAALRVPDGHMVIHGLTGAGGFDAMKRLRTIVETGGLASIAERRRLDIQVTSMSPLGDIASGIDMGVPTKIGESTTYGGTIFFAMRPEILNRRDLWFSDRDFGGGHSRYKEYQAYAKKIGQSHIYDPCPVESRQKHLDTGLGHSNEAYFRHGISWNEVDTIFVTHGMYDQVAQAVNKWKSDGSLPSSLRVESFGEPQEVVEATPGEWVIAPDSGELIYLPDVPGKVQTYTSSISDKIKYRARELARLVD